MLKVATKNFNNFKETKVQKNHHFELFLYCKQKMNLHETSHHPFEQAITK